VNILENRNTSAVHVGPNPLIFTTAEFNKLKLDDLLNSNFIHSLPTIKKRFVNLQMTHPICSEIEKTLTTNDRILPYGLYSIKLYHNNTSYKHEILSFLRKIGNSTFYESQHSIIQFFEKGPGGNIHADKYIKIFQKALLHTKYKCYIRNYDCWGIYHKKQQISGFHKNVVSIKPLSNNWGYYSKYIISFNLKYWNNNSRESLLTNFIYSVYVDGTRDLIHCEELRKNNVLENCAIHKFLRLHYDPNNEPKLMNQCNSPTFTGLTDNKLKPNAYTQRSGAEDQRVLMLKRDIYSKIEAMSDQYLLEQISQNINVMQNNKQGYKKSEAETESTIPIDYPYSY